MFRKMRIFKQQLEQKECIEVLKSQPRGVLSILGEDGYPYGIPIDYWYCEEENRIYFHGAKEGHKIDAIKECDKASFCVYDEGYREEGEWALNIKSVIIDLRGNSGGTDEYFELLSCLFNKDVVIQESFKNLFSKETETYDNVLITHGTNIDYKKFVLVDKKVFSTAERLSEGLQKTKSAIVLGERTLGEGYGFTPLQLDLVNNYCGKYRKNRKARNVSLQFTLEAPINKLGKIDYKNNYCMIPDIECEPASALSIAEELAMDMQVKNKEKLNLLKTKLELLNQKQIVDNYNAYQQESNKLTLNRKKSGFIDAIYLLLILGLIIIMGIVIANLMV